MNDADLHFERLHGHAIAPRVDALADLRLRVFKEFPYLYEGDRAYERAYLKTYVESARSLLFAVFDEDTLIGATTALPLIDEEPAFREPLAGAGYSPERVFYFGESLLLPAYRGRGLGHRFFDEREAWARACGDFSYACFCAVERPADHPARPAQYRGNDGFWQRRGYTRHESIQAHYAWRDVDATCEDTKRLTFWIRALD